MSRIEYHFCCLCILLVTQTPITSRYMCVCVCVRVCVCSCVCVSTGYALCAGTYVVRSYMPCQAYLAARLNFHKKLS